jgi:hypothetical protein
MQPIPNPWGQQQVFLPPSPFSLLAGKIGVVTTFPQQPPESPWPWTTLDRRQNRWFVSQRYLTLVPVASMSHDNT